MKCNKCRFAKKQVQFNIPTDREIAEQARALILSDLSLYDSVPGLSKKIGTNPYKLKKVFEKYYKESVFQFSRRVRMERAKELLVKTNYTLQVIGEMVGYSEGGNFQVGFRTVVGCTPGEYRRKYLTL